MQRVFVLSSSTKQALMPCHPVRARQLLKQGRRAVFRTYPFTIILKDRGEGERQAIQFKVDPGSKTSGLALVADFQRGKRCVWAGELSHRGQQIRDNLLSRRQVRRSRRNRKTRYRQARFKNRCREAGWLAPSLLSRVDNIQTWFKRLSRFAPLTSLAMELVRFDTQKMENAEISGIEYQQGTLLGYEVREYLLEKWDRKCAYCGISKVPLEVEHIIPKVRGGSNQVSNLTIACRACNQAKDNQTATEFGFPIIQKQATISLKDATAINATRWNLFERLHATGLPLEVGTGGQSKYNRIQQNYPKTHWLDAVCVAESGAEVFVSQSMSPLMIQATGRQSRQMCRVNKFGFPRTRAKQSRTVKGFQTGDIVKAIVIDGKKAGTYVGRVAVRANAYFNIRTSHELVQGIASQTCRPLHQLDGYSYSISNRFSSL